MTLIVLLFATAVALHLVSGQEQQFPYELAIHFHQYTNPSHTLSNGLCCNFLGCDTDCDTFLFFCVNTGETNHNSSNCSIYWEFLGSIGGDNVNFNDTVGDSENPLVIVITFLPTSGYQLYIELYVTDRLSVIDGIFVEIPASALGESSFPQLYSGERQNQSLVTINLSYSLGCSPNYTLCTVNTVLQCVPEDDCVDGSESLSTLMPRTTLIVLPDQSLDSSTILAPISYSSSQSPTISFEMDATPSSIVSTTPSSSFSTDVATSAEAVSVAAIAGAVLGVLVFAAVIIILVVVGVAIAHHKKKRQPSPASEANTYMTYSELYRENSVHNSSQPTAALTHQQPSEHIDYEEVGDRAQGNTYEAVDPDQDPESTMVNVANPVYHQPTTLSESREPLYEEAQADQDRSRSNTLTEVSNPMYGTTQTQGGKELECQETQREVENELYGDRTDVDLDSKD